MLKLDHVGVVVDKFEESIEFYKAAFGWEHCGGDDNERVRIAYLRADNQIIELLKYAKDEEGSRPAGRVDHLAFTVDDIEKEIERITALGAEKIFEVPREMADKRITFLRGLSGERLELVEYKK